MIADIIDVLADPQDASPLTLVASHTLASTVNANVTFPVREGGYAVFSAGAGDSEVMVTARETFLSGGHFAPFVEAVSEQVDDLIADDVNDPVILDAGAGTGYYLAHTLDRVDDSRGVGLDVSEYAAAVLATAHPRIGAAVADVREPLPIATGSIDVVCSVFSPYNLTEFARVLRPAGHVVALTPAEGHLDQLRERLGITEVAGGQSSELVGAASQDFEAVGPTRVVEFLMQLDRSSIANQVAMSPSAQHIDPDELAARVEELESPLALTARADLTVLRKR